MNEPARTIVTGGAGFVGGHLVDRLVGDGHQVLVIDDLSTGRVENVAGEARLEQVDIATGRLDELFDHWRPSVVYHLAAQASVPSSMDDPLRDIAVNVIGTHRVALASRRVGADRLVFVSTGGGIYGETERPATETTIPAPHSYYGAHKLAAESHVMLSGLPYAIARPSNIYGPRQAAGLEGAVVAAFIRQATEDGRFRIHGDGQQTRDLINVVDVVQALWRLGVPETPVGIYNVSSGQATRINDLATMIERDLGRRLERVSSPRRAGDVVHSVLSNARLRHLGWTATVTLSEGIASLLKDATSA